MVKGLAVDYPSLSCKLYWGFIKLQREEQFL